MATKGTKKKPAAKRKGKSRKQQKGLVAVLRRWALPLFLLMLIGISLAATFYLIFLHTPATPLF